MRNIKRSTRTLFGVFTLMLVLSLSIWVGCGQQQTGVTEPEAVQELVLNPTDAQVVATMEVQDRYTDELMKNTGIVGTATGMTEDGRPAIIVFVKNDALAKAAPLPEELEEVPVIVQITGEFKALKGPPGGGGGFDPTARVRPAPNGVSIGHPDITAGTLGCLVESGNTTYILSNNHVMANENLASVGDAIIQPGTFDGGSSTADDIATLSAFEPIVFSTSANNVIDAAIATVDPGDVTGETHSSSYGAPNSTTVNASVRMRVQKYGRTTDHTNGRVTAINATVNVGYDSGTARFVNQIVIGGGGFSSGGDSGSLIVTRNNNRNPVGLLFAGGGGSTIANPIDAVLTEFGVTIVGN